MATIAAICISEKRGTQKHPVPEAQLRCDCGIVGDAHAGNWHRQVSILSQYSVARMQEKLSNFQLKPGDFAENILIDDMEVKSLPIGQQLKLGAQAVGEVTQIGKACHNDCIIRQTAGDCVMPREGVFLKIIQPGTIHTGDAVELI